MLAAGADPKAGPPYLCLPLCFDFAAISGSFLPVILVLTRMLRLEARLESLECTGGFGSSAYLGV